jgi:hypothetical protein
LSINHPPQFQRLFVAVVHIGQALFAWRRKFLVLIYLAALLAGGTAHAGQPARKVNQFFLRFLLFFDYAVKLKIAFTLIRFAPFFDLSKKDNRPWMAGVKRVVPC